jgi:hypothetical protein
MLNHPLDIVVTRDIKRKLFNILVFESLYRLEVTRASIDFTSLLGKLLTSGKYQLLSYDEGGWVLAMRSQFHLESNQ